MSKLILKVSTSKVNSTCNVDLGYTKEEWDKLNHKEQDEIVNECMWDVVNCWIEEEK